jgi:hypothetical protein
MEMESGTAINASNKYDVWNTSIPYAIAYQGLRTVADNEYIVAFQDRGDYVFGLSNTSRLLKVNSSDRVLLGSWPLRRWEGELTPEINQIYFLGDIPERYGGENWFNYSQGDPRNSVGCLNAHPLQYGDLDSDGSPELVLMLGEEELQRDFIVFSPQLGEVVFSMRYALQDYIRTPQRQRKEGVHQYQSLNNMIIGLPGQRIYAKAYIGHFSSPEARDILVWRKRYETQLVGAEQEGFFLSGQMFNHYVRVDGRYVLQDSAEATIRSWLSNNNLTWQKGFPSKSECPGEEGQLIPEMHDPLLNDPDVLQ